MRTRAGPDDEIDGTFSAALSLSGRADRHGRYDRRAGCLAGAATGGRAERAASPETPSFACWSSTPPRAGSASSIARGRSRLKRICSSVSGWMTPRRTSAPPT